MPLAIQAVLPLLVLLLAAAVVRLRGRNPHNGWIALAATALAGVIALIELLRLAPGERVDVPYVTTFPYAELLIRLDGLSLSFATVTLITAALLMLVRQWDQGSDRRDPWLGWLLTSAAACALILAGNLLLLYILLQVLTLAWSGALDETAPRRRRLRLALQIADIGLLLAAASAIQSVGTSSYSGVPSDTFGVASFWLMLLPVLVRIAALASGARRQQAAVAFGPAIAWLAPAAYVLMRLLALMGGRLPDRPTAVVIFGIGSAGAIILAAVALWTRRQVERASLLLAAQVSVALALSSGSEPLLTVACTWMWLLVIPLAGLISVRTAAHPDAEIMTRFQLSMIPGSIAFTAVWLGALTLNQLGLLLGLIPILLAIVLAAIASFAGAPRPRSIALHPITAWAIALTLIGALPLLAMTPLVLPTASTVRLVPAGTVSAGLLGLSTAFGNWPALGVCLAVSAAIVLTLRLRVRVRMIARLSAMGPQLLAWRPGAPLRLALPPATAESSVAGITQRRWPIALLWGAFGVVLIVALARP